MPSYRTEFVHEQELHSVQERLYADLTRHGYLMVWGVEVTQAIQRYQSAQHLSDPADLGPNNSVTLIAHKPAWVRVYVRSLFVPASNVSGTIRVKRRRFGVLYGTIGTVAPQPPGSVDTIPGPNYASERGTLNSSLNFVLPENYMWGHLRLEVRVTAPNGHPNEQILDLDVTLQQTLRLAGIMIGYNGPSANAPPGAPNVTIAAPTIADLQTTSAWTLLTYPVQSSATYRTAGTITLTNPLTDAPSCNGCCSPNWVALNADVQAQRVADGNRTDVLYYGLMAPGIPMGPIIGCASGGVSSGSAGDFVTMAHELGHVCGLDHAPCGVQGDPNNPYPYPAYEPYDPANTPQASIGEYGLDISNGNIFSPAVFKDLMSYCGPRWISLYNYGRLTNNARLDPVRVGMDNPWWSEVVLQEPLLSPKKWLPDPPPDPDWRQRVVSPEAVISIIGIAHSDDDIQIKSVMRTEAWREIQNSRISDFVAELVSAEGRTLASAPVLRLRSNWQHSCGCTTEVAERSYPYLFQAFVSNVGGGAMLRLRRGNKDVWTRNAPEGEPRVSNFDARISKIEIVGVRLAVNWEVKSASKYEAEGWLQWSNDRGKSWYALATGLQGKSAMLDVSNVPPGSVMLRLLWSDGYYTAVSKPIEVEIPARPPTVSILSPREGQTLISGQTMRLFGVATLDSGESVAAKDVRWLLNGKPLEEGLDVFIVAPDAGEHRLTLVFTGDGGEEERAVRFKTVKAPS